MPARQAISATFTDKTWLTSKGTPRPRCHLGRNWQPPPVPTVQRFLAAGAGIGYGSGDVLSIIFDAPTQQSAGELQSGGRAYVDSLFSFITTLHAYDFSVRAEGEYVPGGIPGVLGDDYSGEWENEWTFVITVTTSEAPARSRAPSLLTRRLTARPSLARAQVLDASGASLALTGAGALLPHPHSLTHPPPQHHTLRHRTSHPHQRRAPPERP